VKLKVEVDVDDWLELTCHAASAVGYLGAGGEGGKQIGQRLKASLDKCRSRVWEKVLAEEVSK
jgi:hypothetical protein